MAKTVPAAFAAASLLACGCSSDSQRALASEVNALTKVGEPLDAAAAKLRSAGFECGDNYYADHVPADMLCARDRNYYVVATCIQRVYLSADKSTKAVTRLDVERPNCTGF